MPRLNISLRAGKPEAYRQAILDSLYRAMRDALAVPEDDQFMTITEHDAANFRHGAAFGVARSEDLVYIQIIVFDTRTPDQKKAVLSTGPQTCSANTRASVRRMCSSTSSRPRKRTGLSATASRNFA